MSVNDQQVCGHVKKKRTGCTCLMVAALAIVAACLSVASCYHFGGSYSYVEQDYEATRVTVGDFRVGFRLLGQHGRDAATARFACPCRALLYVRTESQSVGALEVLQVTLVPAEGETATWEYAPAEWVSFEEKGAGGRRAFLELPSFDGPHRDYVLHLRFRTDESAVEQQAIILVEAVTREGTGNAFLDMLMSV